MFRGGSMRKDRLPANREILKILSEYIDKNPDLRFIQALWALKIIDRDEPGIIDRFHEESMDTLKKLLVTK